MSSSGTPFRRLLTAVDPRRLLRAIVAIDDTPHSIALGAAIGMFIALTPTVGVQMLMVLGVALCTRRLFRFNRLAGLIAVYVSNPLTMIPIYWFNYRVGTLFVDETVTVQEFYEIVRYHNVSEWRHSLESLFFTVGTPLLLGSAVVGLVAAAITYPLVRALAQRGQQDRRLPSAEPPRLESPRSSVLRRDHGSDARVGCHSIDL